MKNNRKTLIFNGSPNKKGDTVSLITTMTKHLDGKCKIVNAFQCKINPCNNCKYCRENIGCNLKDDMNEVYDYIQECDNILIASPVYYSELSGQLLSISSRLQTYFCARLFRREEPIEKTKKGGVILLGGQEDGGYRRAYDTACRLLNEMNAPNIAPVVYCGNLDDTGRGKDPRAVVEANNLAKYFNMVS